MAAPQDRKPIIIIKAFQLVTKNACYNNEFGWPTNCSTFSREEEGREHARVVM